MTGQMNISDFLDTDNLYLYQKIILEECMKAPEPLCASCQSAIKRGPFRLCQKGKKGYRHIGEEVTCRQYTAIE